MPTYFFDVLDDGEVVADDQGIDLPDLDAARDKKRSGADCRGCVTGRDVTQSFGSATMSAGSSRCRSERP
jgi:hypothetical protein